MLDGPIEGGGGGSSGTESGFLYYSSGTVGIVKIDVAMSDHEITGVTTNATAVGETATTAGGTSMVARSRPRYASATECNPSS
jgi:hypothetical protein